MPDFVTPHGGVFTWGTTSFYLTSIQVNAQAGSEIDITSMSSEVVTDPQNSSHKLVVPDFDTSISARYGTDISIEFMADTQIAQANYFDCVGSKRKLSVSFRRSDSNNAQGFRITERPAILMNMSIGAQSGEFVRGSAMFRLSGL